MSSLYPTAHIAATPDDFAKTVLMPGDPLRAKYIAESFFESPRLVNNIRGVQGYTGTYKGTAVSVMASGMGIPSIGIYSYELFNFFDVDNIIRVGSAGAISENVKIRDVILGMGSCTDSNYASQFCLPGTFAPLCSFKLLETAANIARAKKYPFHVGSLLSSDRFYDDSNSALDWAKMGVLAVEMESAALYMNAARSGKNALTICTISNHIVTGAETTAEERQTSFNDMIELALETAVQLDRE